MNLLNFHFGSVDHKMKHLQKRKKKTKKEEKQQQNPVH